MGLKNWSNLGRVAPIMLPTVALAELSTSMILPTPVLELRQAQPTTDGLTNTSTSTSSSDDDDPTHHFFNYYFLLIAICIAILLLGFMIVGRRKKQKTLRMLHTRQEALRRDLEAWPGGRARPPPLDTSSSRWPTGGRNWRSRNADDMGVTRHDEGLDDLGEAPPPYNPGDKPPSIAAGREPSHAGDGEVADSEGRLAVPLRTLSRSNINHNPPGYFESISNNGSEESAWIPRPEAAMTPTTPRFSVARGLLDGTDGEYHQSHIINDSEADLGIARPNIAATPTTPRFNSSRRLLDESSSH